MYFRCCPSCNAWASNHIGVGCLPTTRDQESEIQKIISYSYEDITSHSIDEINPEKEETICNLCEELHKKRKPIDAFTEVLEIESTTEAIQDYETLFATLPHSTTIMNKLGREIMEIETSTQKIEDVSSIQDLKNEIVINDENTKIDKESVSPIGENNEDIHIANRGIKLFLKKHPLLVLMLCTCGDAVNSLALMLRSGDSPRFFNNILCWCLCCALVGVDAVCVVVCCWCGCCSD